MNELAIIGFGLIGGSLASAARVAGFAQHITAIDVSSVLDSREAERAADVRIDVADRERVARALAQAQLTVLAAPATVIRDGVAAALEHATVVTDCGSTKRQIVERARQSRRFSRFVPGHPMAGLPQGGLRNASAELFRGRPWILCPEEADDDAVALVSELVRAVGARLATMSAAEHDAAVARTSHVPQLLASALSVTAQSESAQRAVGPAFERATHIAGGPESMWHDIFSTNGDEISRALRELLRELEPVANELEAGAGTHAADALLARARQLRVTRRDD